MDKEILKRNLRNFSNKKKVKQISDTEEEICDLVTGECHVIKSKDGLVERINKKFIIEDGRQLLVD